MVDVLVTISENKVPNLAEISVEVDMISVNFREHVPHVFYEPSVAL